MLEYTVAQCSIGPIDQLLAGTANAQPIGEGSADKESVGAIQDLLTGQGAKGLPNLLSGNYGNFGFLTTAAVVAFRNQHTLPAGQTVDTVTLQAMVRAPAPAPIASRAYLTLVLDKPYSGMAKILSVVAQLEGAGRFAALNLNTDSAGLSFGLIQWAQRPGRLAEILAAFNGTSRADFVRIFAQGDATLADRLLAHTRKPNGGVDPRTGSTIDPAFDLVQEPWVGRFRQAALQIDFQKAQVETALADFKQSRDHIRRFAPKLESELGIAFMIDLSNQFGDGGARNIYQCVYKSGISESDLLSGIAAESVRRIDARFKAGTEARRQSFLATTFLSDTPFAEPGDADQLA